MNDVKEHSSRLRGREALCAWPLGQAFDDGGGRRDRTDDLLLAKQALSQLSYSPGLDPGGSGWIRTIDPRLIKTVL